MMMTSSDSEDGDNEPAMFACKICPGTLFTAAEKDAHRAYHKRLATDQSSGRGRGRQPKPNPAKKYFAIRGRPTAGLRRTRPEATTSSASPQEDTNQREAASDNQSPSSGPSIIWEQIASRSLPRPLAEPPATLPQRHPKAEELREKLRQKFNSFRAGRLNDVQQTNGRITAVVGVAGPSNATPGPSTSTQATPPSLEEPQEQSGSTRPQVSSSVQTNGQPGESSTTQSSVRVQTGEQPGSSSSNPSNEPRNNEAPITSGSRGQRRPRRRFRTKWEKIVSYKCPYCPGKLFRANERAAHDREHFPVHYGAGEGSNEPEQQRQGHMYECVRCPGLAFTRIEKKMHQRHHKLGQRLASRRLNRN